MTLIEKNDKNLKKCSCIKCPSYNDCAKGKKESLYCAEIVGKSKCKYKMNGCLCMTCPVHAKFNLKAGYYCINGSAE